MPKGRAEHEVIEIMKKWKISIFLNIKKIESFRINKNNIVVRNYCRYLIIFVYDCFLSPTLGPQEDAHIAGALVLANLIEEADVWVKDGGAGDRLPELRASVVGDLRYVNLLQVVGQASSTCHIRTHKISFTHHCLTLTCCRALFLTIHHPINYRRMLKASYEVWTETSEVIEKRILYRPTVLPQPDNVQSWPAHEAEPSSISMGET